MYFVADDRIENEVSEPRRDNHPRIRLIGRSAFLRIESKKSRSFDKPNDQAGSDFGTFLADVGVYLIKIALCRTGEADLHAP
ncbi:MAG: hypothetical protein PS018_06010 [bacterium]|nr:hypothetical protein [bacterium]